MPVRPGELLFVEHAGAVADAVQRKPARELVDRHELGIVTATAAAGVARRPADEREVVHQRLRQVPLRAELRDRRRAVALRQRAVVRAHHKREVREGRRRKPQRLVYENLPRRVGNVILAANHMRDLHQRVVDDDGKVVRGRAVGADDDRIADHVGLKPHVSAHRVGEDDVALLRHAEADRRTLARRDARGGGVARQAPARAGVARRTSVRDRVLTLGVELRRRAETVVRVVRAEQLLRVRLIEVQPLGLPVRPVPAADVRPLIPLEAQPAQIADNRRLRLARRALDVGVLDAQDDGAAGTAREQPVEQRRPRVADVELTGGARCKTQSHG